MAEDQVLRFHAGHFVLLRPQVHRSEIEGDAVFARHIVAEIALVAGNKVDVPLHHRQPICLADGKKVCTATALCKDIPCRGAAFFPCGIHDAGAVCLRDAGAARVVGKLFFRQITAGKRQCIRRHGSLLWLVRNRCAGSQPQSPEFWHRSRSAPHWQGCRSAPRWTCRTGR